MATIAETPAHVLARKVWGAFAFTFVISRILVFLSMSGRMPDIHPQLGGTRLHHLNYGIFLLAGVGAALLFSRPTGRWLSATAILYGVALALTFDEFGMWLHLDAVYWQRASFDAMILIAAILGLIMAAPTVRRFRLRHWIWTVVMTLVVIWFTLLLIKPFQRMHERIAPWFRRMDHPPVTDTLIVAPPRVPAQPPAGPSQRIRK